MLMDDYQAETVSTSLYKDQEPFLLGLGINEEAGEVAGKIKKHFRDGIPMDITREQVKLELGDTLWYLARIAAYFNLRLSDVALANQQKLASRRARGTINGSGDNR